MDPHAQSNTSLPPTPQGSHLFGEFKGQPQGSPQSPSSQSMDTPNSSSQTETSVSRPSGPDALGRLTHETAERLHRLAAEVRNKGNRVPEGAFTERLAQNTAKVVEGAATLLDETSTRSLQEALRTQIQRHPWLTLGLGVSLGVWVGRTLKR